MYITSSDRNAYIFILFVLVFYVDQSLLLFCVTFYILTIVINLISE